MSDVVLGRSPSSADMRAGRDAIHVAVVPVTSPFLPLRGGEAVRFISASEVRLCVFGEDPDGIVDPYLLKVVMPGQPFWMCLMPGTVTGMRHHWSHPVLDGMDGMDGMDKPSAVAQPQVTVPKAGLYRTVNTDSIPDEILEIARDCGKTYHELMADAREYVNDGVGVLDNSQLYENVCTSQWDKFWDHFRQVEGKEPGDRWAPYHCAC